jgi:hypothetical protein
LEKAVIEIDSGYRGTLQYLKNDEHYDRTRLYREFILPVVLHPRLEALQAMREGFTIVPIANHLAAFPSAVFQQSFVALEVCYFNFNFKFNFIKYCIFLVLFFASATCE